MRPAHWQIADDRIAGCAGHQIHHCASAGGSRPPAKWCKSRGDEGGSTIEFTLYLPRRAWHFTFTRERTTPLTFSGIPHTDDRDQIAAPTVS